MFLFLAHFPNFWDIILKKNSGSFTHNNTWAYDTIKKLMHQSQENFWTERWKDERMEKDRWTDPNSQNPSSHRLKES